MSALTKWIMGRWFSYCRALDLQFLWEALKEEAHDLDTAKIAFAMHAFKDPAWLVLGREKIKETIDGLK